MGVSTDAIIAYGMNLGEDWHSKVPWGEIEDDYGYTIDWEEWVADEAGVGYGTEATYEDRRAVLDAFPVEVIHHCSDEVPHLFLAVPGTKLRARRGYPERIEALEVEDGFDAGLEKVNAYLGTLSEWGIEDEEFGWYLFSYWG